MRIKATMIAVATALMLSALPALAAMPTPGIYFSTDLGGQVLLGRGSQSWIAPLNVNRGLGDVFNAQSWTPEGAPDVSIEGLLGTQWIFQCGVQLAPQGQVDNRDANGNGTVIFTNVFTGGIFFLSKNGPWGDGINDLTGQIFTTTAIATVVYVNSIPIQSRLNLDTYGQFDGSSCVLRFAIANGVGLGDTDLLAFPPEYPPLMDTDCAPTRVNGSWGDIKDITLQIECPVPTRSGTWGSVKTRYR
ncbi:MAG: hypothetical protein HOP12_07080 [Candidatus Eisenbacteria bacterium]|uniref:Uncharacterized protein n=1 Tax=Eiseniibacteriota bacterium TaxID=2212470 RepID=A0A849SM67_UNCEI|nr:hypothetical protein [Candidatus Eisenbacteria bacterium]